MSLRSVLSDEEIAALFAITTPETHRHFNGHADRLKEFFSWSRLNDSLNSLRLPSGSVRLFKDGNSLSYTSALDLIRETKGGATLIFDDLDRHDAKLGRCIDGIEGELGFPARANLYLSYPETQGFYAHYDTHAFLILQISGSKEWAIYEQREEAPLYHQKQHRRLEASELRLAERVLLNQGDVLFVPKGQWHDATAKGGPSVHLTLGLFAPTGIDFANWLVDELRGDLSCRLDFPWGNSPTARGDSAIDAALQEAISRVKSSLETQFLDENLAARFLAHRSSAREVRNRLHFPQHVKEETNFANDQDFYLACQSLSFFSQTDADKILLVGADLQFEIPHSFRSILNLLVQQKRCEYSDFLKASDDIPKAELDAFLRSLIAYGILETSRISID